MNKSLKNLIRPAADIWWRRQELQRPRRGHLPGKADIRNLTSTSFEARSNFYWLEGEKALGSGGRPSWTPLYVTPRRRKGTAINFFSEPDPNGWPMEAGLTDPDSGDWVTVVDQFAWTNVEVSETQLRNEHVIGGWLRGQFETSAVWDLVMIPEDRINWGRVDDMKLVIVFDEHLNSYVGWASDLWLGNNGLLLAPSGDF